MTMKVTFISTAAFAAILSWTLLMTPLVVSSTTVSEYHHHHQNEQRIIGAEFVDRNYRIERQFFPASVASKLLKDLVHDGIPRENEGGFPVLGVKKIGDKGQTTIDQHDADVYGLALQNFTKAEFHEEQESKHSLVYYIERLEQVPSSYDRSIEILSRVASPDILANGGTAHLYMSAPGTSALDNHTDTTSIVVLQLDGAKEWLLCSEKEAKESDSSKSVMIPPFLRKGDFSHKLDSCSSDLRKCGD